MKNFTSCIPTQQFWGQQCLNSVHCHKINRAKPEKFNKAVDGPTKNANYRWGNFNTVSIHVEEADYSKYETTKCNAALKMSRSNLR